MDLQKLQQQLDQYARLHGLTGMNLIVRNDGSAMAYQAERPDGDLQHVIVAPANDMGAELARRIGLAMDRRCA